MELQELVERIQRWRQRQGLSAPVESEARPYAPPLSMDAEPVEEPAAEVAADQIAELDVEPEAVVAEEATSELAVESIEEVD